MTWEQKVSKRLSEARKALVALTGFGGTVVADNLVHGSALRYTVAAVAISTAVLTYLIPNAAISTDESVGAPTNSQGDL